MSDHDLYQAHGAGGEAEGTGRHKKTERKTRQLTVKGVEDETFHLAREAAQRSGLRISSWIRMQLREAAERVLHEQREGPTFDPDILAEISQQLKEITKEQKAEREKIENIRNEISDIIKAQHGMMSKLLMAE